MNAQTHLATTATSLKTVIVFLKKNDLLEAEAAIIIVLTCFSIANFKSRMTPKIFNSETISTIEPSMIKLGNKGSTVRERKIKHPSCLAWIHQHTPPTAPIADHCQIIIQ